MAKELLRLCQSPSHQGTHFYASNMSELTSNAMCQSPSHRGTHFYGIYNLGKSKSVSIPFTSGNSFLRSRQDHSWGASTVSIPFTSGNSFLPDGSTFTVPVKTCVNPLHVGELITTESIAIYGDETFNVSIPFTSGNSFLQE